MVNLWPFWMKHIVGVGEGRKNANLFSNHFLESIAEELGRVPSCFGDIAFSGL